MYNMIINANIDFSDQAIVEWNIVLSRKYMKLAILRKENIRKSAATTSMKKL